MPRTIDEPALFSVVFETWVERGYAGTATRQVAERAGVNEATLFRRYGGKGELVVAALKAALRRVPLRTVSPTDALPADLVRLVEAYLETQREVGAVFPLLLMEAPRHPELRPALATAWENVGALVRVIEHHQARGALHPEHPTRALFALIGPLFAVGLARGLQPGLPPVDAEAHVQAFLVGRGVRAPAADP
jgi:AcrR family transcriptional regulator